MRQFMLLVSFFSFIFLTSCSKNEVPAEPSNPILSHINGYWDVLPVSVLKMKYLKAYWPHYWENNVQPIINSKVLITVKSSVKTYYSGVHIFTGILELPFDIKKSTDEELLHVFIGDLENPALKMEYWKPWGITAFDDHYAGFSDYTYSKTGLLRDDFEVLYDFKVKLVILDKTFDKFFAGDTWWFNYKYSLIAPDNGIGFVYSWRRANSNIVPPETVLLSGKDTTVRLENVFWINMGR